VREDSLALKQSQGWHREEMTPPGLPKAWARKEGTQALVVRNVH
jgi:hypothetical protein